MSRTSTRSAWNEVAIFTQPVGRWFSTGFFITCNYKICIYHHMLLDSRAVTFVSLRQSFLRSVKARCLLYSYQLFIQVKTISQVIVHCLTTWVTLAILWSSSTDLITAIITTITTKIIIMMIIVINTRDMMEPVHFRRTQILWIKSAQIRIWIRICFTTKVRWSNHLS